MKKFGTISIVSAATALPAALLISGLVSWQLKSSNSDNVDITQGLAYLRPILVSGIVVFSIFLVVSIMSGFMALKKDQDKTTSKLGITLAVTILVLSAAVAVVNKKNSDVIDSYNQQKQEQFYDDVRGMNTN